MPWIKKPVPKCEGCHPRIKLPDLDTGHYYVKGSVWECPECGQWYRVVEGEWGECWVMMTDRQVQKWRKRNG